MPAENRPLTKLHIYLLYTAIIIAELIWAVSYTGNLAIGWIIMIFIAPAIGVFIGFCIILLFRLFKVKIIYPHFSSSLCFALFFSFFLAIEEMDYGFINRQYNKYIDLARVAEAKKSVHEINLGFGKILYFTGNEQSSFNLNFEYQGKKQITRDQIIELAKDFCIQNKYNFNTLHYFKVHNLTQYTKAGLIVVKSPDEYLIMKVGIQDGPIGRFGRIKAIDLTPKYAGGEIKVVLNTR